MNEQSDYEVTLDLLNLVGHLVIKWKTILLVSLIAAIIGSMIGFIIVRRNNTAVFEEDRIKTTGTELQEEKKIELQAYFDQLVAYDNMIEEQKHINDESYIMCLNPDVSIGCDLFYLLDTDVYNIFDYYTSSILSEDDISKISDKLEDRVGEKDLDEIVVFRTSESFDRVFDENKCILKVTIVTPEKDSCNEVLKIVDKAIIRETKYLKDNGAKIECRFVSQRYNTTVRDYIALVQNEKVTNLGQAYLNKSNFVNSVISKLDADKIEYINSLIEERPIEDNEKTENETIAYEKVYYFCSVSLIIGLLISIAWYVLLYFIDGRLRTAEELKDSFGFPIMQIISFGDPDKTLSKYDFITKFGQKLLQVGPVTPDGSDMLCEEIGNMARRAGIKKIYFAADKSSPGAIEVVRGISQNISNDTIFTEGGICLDASDLKQLLTSDGVVMFPVIDSTKIKHIKEFKNFCERNGINIFGAVAIIGCNS